MSATTRQQSASRGILGARSIVGDVNPSPAVVGLDAVLPADLGRCADLVAEQLRAGVPPTHRLAVAYSGGVDSAVLAVLAARALGPGRVVLVLGVSPSLARREHRFAAGQARQIGIDLVEIPTGETDDPGYAANPVDRCYYCKDVLFETIAARLDPVVIAYGENADDALRPDRPGGRAATEHRVLRPLASAGLSKATIRRLATCWQLASADKPAAPCLASRIPHGEPVTAEKLAAVDRAEDAVLAAGFSDCRVRHHGQIARIEVPVAEFGRLCDPEVRAALLDAVRACGFTFVTVDLAGVQSGTFTTTLLGLPH